MNKLIVASMFLMVLLLPFAWAEEERGNNSNTETEEKKKTYEVTNVKSFLNIRSGPGTIYSILRAISNTEKDITIVASKQLEESTWVKIKHNDEYGWVNKVYLKAQEVIKTKETMNEEQPPLWLTMSGVYSLTNIAPKKGEEMNTHMLFQVESEQAKIIYDAIKTPAFVDKCTGASAKKVGEMLCLHYPTPKEKQQAKITDKKDVSKDVSEESNTASPSPVAKSEKTDKQPSIVEQATQEAVEEEDDFVETSAEITDIYECHFSINIMQQRIQQGIPCEE